MGININGFGINYAYPESGEGARVIAVFIGLGIRIDFHGSIAEYRTELLKD